MIYEVKILGSAIRELRKLDKTVAGKILITATEKLSKNPENYKVLTGEFAGLRRLRIGDYRVIFAIFDNEVRILRIGHRKNIYE